MSAMRDHRFDPSLMLDSMAFDADAWDVPDHLSLRDCEVMTGADAWVSQRLAPRDLDGDNP